jgi:hypothetical protein
MWKLVSHIKKRTEIKGVWEQGTENIWAKEEAEKTA